MIGLGLSISVGQNKPGTSTPAVNNGWDSADTGAGITLSNDDKTATCSVSVGATNTQSTTSHTSSTLRYYEIETTFGIADYRPGLAADSVTGLVGTGNSVCYLPSGTIQENSATVKTIGSYTTGAVLQFWLKPSTGEYWVGANDTVDGDPSTESSPTGTLTVETFKAAFSPRRLNNAGTIRTTSAEFSYSAQGATAWDE